MIQDLSDRRQAVLATISALEADPERLNRFWCVPPEQAQVLYGLARTVGAQRMLEVGTSLAYSTLWLGLALLDNAASDPVTSGIGHIHALEANAERATMAQTHVASAGLTDCVTVYPAEALTWMAAQNEMAARQAQPQTPYDLIFIDANKAQTLAYWQWLQPWVQSGSLVLVDNTQSHRAPMQDFLATVHHDARWASWELTWGNGLWVGRRL
jgi:predicted O-methyltransferase YrrM